MSDDRGIWATPQEVDAYLEREGFILGGDETEDRSGTYCKDTVRTLFFPSSFRKAVHEHFKDVKSCQLHLDAECEGTENLTYDHIVPVSHYFNTEGYRKSRAEREEWYNDCKNLRVVCRHCNSKKGGERFRLDKVKECFLRGKDR